MGINKNKATRQNENRKIVGAIRKHLRESVTLEGVKYTPARLAKMFQNGIDIADATDVASKAWHTAAAAAVSAAPPATPAAPAAPEGPTTAPVLAPSATSQTNGAPVAAKAIASA